MNWTLDQERWRWFTITISSTTCAAIFSVIYLRTREKRIASEVTAICHHVTVVILASICLMLNRDWVLKDAILSESSQFPLVNTIQWINLGYFLYDSVHAVVWEHAFIVHHAVALMGFGVSDQAGVGGLSNAVNTLIAEIGSVAYNIYNKNPSKQNYVSFILVYAISRLFLCAWSVIIFFQVREHLSWSMSLPVLAVSLQIVVVTVNFHFLSVHLLNFRSFLENDKADGHVKKHL
jgi:hypothetical protein